MTQSNNPGNFQNKKGGEFEPDWRYRLKMVLSLVGCVMLGALIANVMPTNEMSLAVIVGLIIGLMVGRLTARWEIWHMVRKVEDRVAELVATGKIDPHQMTPPMHVEIKPTSAPAAAPAPRTHHKK